MYTAGEVIALGEKCVSLTTNIIDLNVNSEKTLSLLADCLKTNSFTGAESVHGAYIHSEDLAVVAKGSDTVIVAVPRQIISDIEEDRTVVRCEVKERIKGQLPEDNRVVVFKDSVRLGEPVVLFLKQAGEKSSTYGMSSPVSVQAYSDELVGRLQAIVSK